MFARPGVVGAASNFIYPAQLRALGAKTVYWEMNLRQRVGTPTNPIDPGIVQDWADRVFYRAVASSGCATPWIALNEMWGSNLATPWSPTNTQYRDNVLQFVRRLSALGAHPFLLLNSRPFTDGEAGDWWRQVALYTNFVREVYFAAPQIYRQGPVLGSRNLRNAFRQGVTDLTSIGIPVVEDRHLPRLPHEPGPGRPRAPEARERVVRHDQVAGARDRAGEPRDSAGDGLVLGLGRVGRGGPRPRQAGRGVRLPLDAQPQPLLGPEDGRAQVRHVADRGPADPARGIAVHDPVGPARKLSALERRARDRRPRDRVHVALRPARPEERGAGQAAGSARRRTGDHPLPIRRQRRRLPRRAGPRRRLDRDRARRDLRRAPAGARSSATSGSRLRRGRRSRATARATRRPRLASSRSSPLRPGSGTAAAVSRSTAWRPHPSSGSPATAGRG